MSLPPYDFPVCALLEAAMEFCPECRGLGYRGPFESKLFDSLLCTNTACDVVWWLPESSWRPPDYSGPLTLYRHGPIRPTVSVGMKEREVWG